MPREKIKRGRRAEAKQKDLKRKLEDSEEHRHFSPKRQRVVNGDDNTTFVDDIPIDQNNTEDTTPEAGVDDRPFYGLLDEQEQNYFKHADQLLEADSFDGAEGRELFLENIYKEADGKELKIACSQSCSRLLERLIVLSSPKQLKQLFPKFSGHFLHLVQHRFASHCCETLFIKCAPIVTAELLKTPSSSGNENGLSWTPEEPSMERLFLDAFRELSENLGYLMTERFASHTFRVLLTIFSGGVITENPVAHRSGPRRKNQNAFGYDKSKELILDQPRTVPQSFTEALREMMDKSVGTLDTHYLRSLATHPTGNPVLQKLLETEMSVFKTQVVHNDHSVLRRLLPEAPTFQDTESASFITNLLYEPVGSRLVETVVRYAPAKLFKAMWKDIFRERFGSFARNEVAGYVMMAVLERLGPEDLQVAHDAMLEQIPSLAARGRTAIIRTLVERCRVRNLETKQLCRAIFNCWADDNGKTFSVCKMLDIPVDIPEKDPHHAPPKHHSSVPTTKPPKLTSPNASATNNGKPSPPNPPSLTKPTRLTPSSSAPPSQTDSASILHRSLLAQSMLTTPGPLADMLFTALSNLSSAVCLHIALTSMLSPVLQSSLTAPHATLVFRRKLITRFYSHIGALSIDPSGSHLVDAIWAGTTGMAFARERIAEELAENEKALRASSYGRKVWRNWKMDLYQRKRAQWVREMREEVGNDGFQSFPDNVTESGSTSRPSSARPSSRRSNGGANGDALGGSIGHKRKANMQTQSQQNASRPMVDADGKTPLDRARERHAQKKAMQSSMRGNPASGSSLGTGANAPLMTSRNMRARPT